MKELTHTEDSTLDVIGVFNFISNMIGKQKSSIFVVIL